MINVYMRTKKISLILSLIGISLLLTLSSIIKPPMFSINDIDRSMINKKVTARGEVFKIRTLEDFTIISLRDETGNIEILAQKNLQIKKNQSVKVIGEVQIYKDSIQIKAEKIILIL
jgi:RecJ-like exonuclease